MNILLKHLIIISLLSVVILAKGQIFSLTDSISTNISKVTNKILPIQSNEDFNFLLYSLKNKKRNFELLTLKDISFNKIEIKNKKVESGGSAYISATMFKEKLILLHIDGFLTTFKKNKKEKYSLKETLHIKGRNFNAISFIDSGTIFLMNYRNYYNEKKLYDNYVLCVFDLRTKKILYQKELDLGKGILLSHFSSTVFMESKNDKIAVAHPTLPFIYIYNQSCPK